MSNRFRVDTSDLKNLPQEIHQGVRLGMELASEMTREKVMDEAPKRSSRLFNSIIAGVEEAGKKIRAIITVTAVSDKGNKPYPLFVAEGTGLFGPKRRIITPKKKSGVLAFEVPGQGIIFRRSVKGQKPNPFHERGLTKAAPFIADEIEKGIGMIKGLQ